MKTVTRTIVDRGTTVATCSLFLLAMFFGSSCKKGQITTTNQPTPSPTSSAASTPTPEISPSVVRNFEGTGVVTKVVRENPYDKSQASVELDHDEIIGLMPAMRMEFYVKDVSLLKGLKVGDLIEFTIEEKGGTEVISRIKKK